MAMEELYVVPSLKAKDDLLTEAASWAQEIGAIFVPRRGRTVAQLRAAYGTEQLLIYTTKGPVIERDEGSHFFSLNMAELRILQLRRGRPDHLLEAFGAKGPVSILDCTCGFGADTIVAAFGLPDGSRVTAIEVSPQLAAVTGWGFRHYVHEAGDVTAALRRIRLHVCNYADYLKAPGPVYDIIYFDPMFSQPVTTSCQFEPVRPIMDHEPLTRECLELALNRARRVVLKGRSFRQFMQDFPKAKLLGGRYSRVGYAVLEGRVHE